MYVLEKLRLLDGKDSMVEAGHKCSSDKLRIFLHGKHELEDVSSIHHLKIGWQVYIGRGFRFLQTSPIEEITKVDENCVHFLTRTSVYELKKVLDND